jgi:copper(I)-binding protein
MPSIPAGRSPRPCRQRAIAALLLSAIAACAPASDSLAQSKYKAGALLIEAPWTRATPGGAKVAGGYLEITNTGRDADRLIGGSLPLATSVEVHEMAMTDGIMRMRRLPKGLEIKPGQKVALEPGGYHLMFMGLTGALKEGETVRGTLTFEKAGSVEVEYRVAPIGARSSRHKMH